MQNICAAICHSVCPRRRFGRCESKSTRLSITIQMNDAFCANYLISPLAEIIRLVSALECGPIRAALLFLLRFFPHPPGSCALAAIACAERFLIYFMISSFAYICSLLSPPRSAHFRRFSALFSRPRLVGSSPPSVDYCTRTTFLRDARDGDANDIGRARACFNCNDCL